MLTLSLLSLALLGFADDTGCLPAQPCYSAAGIANSAANIAGYFAPNSFLTIYGSNLSYVTGSLGLGDISGGKLPIDGEIQGTEVGVLIGNLPGYIYYVSPNQVNVLIPSLLIPGPVTIQLQTRGVYGPPVQSEVVVLYATGLGATSPAIASGELPAAAWPLADLSSFQVQLNGVALDSKSIQYAGDAPGFAGLFQINLQLPANCPSNPEIRIGFGPSSNSSSSLSPAQRYLPVE
jgi:hypothetical protein